MPRLTQKIVGDSTPLVESKVLGAGFRWSEEQEAVFDAVVNTDDNLRVDACAGSGKSSTTFESMRRLKTRYPYCRMIYLAFGKSNQLEAEARVGKKEAKTSHGLGAMAIRQNIQGLPDDLLKNRMRDVVDNYRKWEPKEWAFRSAVQRLASAGRQITSSAPVDLIALADKQGLEMLDRDEEVAGEASRALDAALESNSLEKGIDYDDMLWLPYRLGLPLPQFDIVFGDEVQDWAGIQHWMGMEATKYGGRLAIVGDPAQSIFGWRGAHTSSMDSMVELLHARGGRVLDRELTYTRRCPKSHVELAQRFVPRIQVLDSAPQGTVLRAQTVRQLVARAQPGDFVLSRLNAPLLETAQEFWKAGKPAMVKGREAQAGVMRLYDAAMSKGAVTMRGVVANAQEIAGGEIAKFLSMPEGRGESRAQQSQDRLDCLLALAGDTYDIPVFKRRLAELFGDEADGKKVVLSTIHRAKGLESTGVHILTKKLPHPSAKEGWQREQEDNLIYVALTRGKGDAVLSFVGPDIPGCEEHETD